MGSVVPWIAGSERRSSLYCLKHLQNISEVTLKSVGAHLGVFIFTMCIPLLGYCLRYILTGKASLWP